MAGAMVEPQIELVVESRRISNDFLTALLAGLGLFCLGYSAVGLVALHFIAPDWSPLTDYVSRYALHPYPVIMTSVFYTGACGSLAFAAAYARTYDGDNHVLIGRRIVWFALGLVVLGRFRTTFVWQDIEGVIHDWSAPVVFLIMVTAMRRFGEADFSRLHERSRLLGNIALVSYVIMMSFIFLRFGWVGLAERIMLAAMLAWMGMVAWHLFTRALEVVPKTVI